MKLKNWDANLKVRLIGETLFNLLYWMYFPFIAVYFSQELGNHAAGLLMTVPPLVSILAAMIGGNLSDRWGRRPVMLLGTSLRTVLFALFALSGSYWIDYLAFIGVGFFGSLYKPANDAMIADLVPEKERRQVFATFITGSNIGAVLGPAIGAFFFFHYRSELLWTCAAVMFFYSAMIFLKVRETLPTASTKTGAASLTSSIKGQWNGYGIILRDKIFMIYILAGIFSIFTIMQLDLYFAVYVTHYVPSQPLVSWGGWNLKLSSKDVLGWLLGLNGLLFVLLVLPVTKWLKGWNDRDVFILSTILAGIGMFAVGLTTNIWMLFLLTIVFTLGEIVRSPVMNNFVSDYAPVDARGQYMAAASLQFTLGRFIAPLTVFLSGSVRPIGVFTVILASAMISGFLYIKLFRLTGTAVKKAADSQEIL